MPTGPVCSEYLSVQWVRHGVVCQRWQHVHWLYHRREQNTLRERLCDNIEIKSVPVPHLSVVSEVLRNRNKLQQVVGDSFAACFCEQITVSAHGVG